MRQASSKVSQGKRRESGAAPGFIGQGHAPVADLARVDAARVDAPRLGWQQAIATTVSGLHYELVDVERGQRGLLRVTIDRVPGRTYTVGRGENAVVDAGEAITVDDCEAVTRQLQYALEVEGLDYARLEVSSPGLDRPLKKEADFQRFAGQAVHITLKAPFEGRKVWQGLLGAVDGAADSGAWKLLIKNGKTEQVLGFTLQEVREARLVPVVNFKGRTPAQSADGGADKAAANAAPAVDGGL